MSTDTQTSTLRPGADTRRQGLRWIRIAAALLIGIMVFALAAGAGFLYLDTSYHKAADELASGHYSQAMEIISTVPSWFEDAPDLMEYAQANISLQNEDYQNAYTLFVKADGFNDSETMVLLTDYLYAHSLLDLKQYKEASEIFTTLAGHGYQDSEAMVLETDYRRGLGLMEQENWNDAVDVFTTLSNYSDSPAKLVMAAHGMLRQAEKHYRSGKYAEASKTLDTIADVPQFEKDVELYRVLIEAHGVSIADGLSDYNKVKPIYDKLAVINDIEDSRELMLSDTFLLYYLEGQWREPNYNAYWDFSYDSSKNMWLIKRHDGWGTIHYYIDQKEYKLNNSCIVDMYSNTIQKITPLTDGKIMIYGKNTDGRYVTYDYKRSEVRYLIP